MGIPAYFSYIIKSHVHVLLSANTIQQQYGNLQHLYMDCNSVVYDVFHECSKTNTNPSFEEIVDGVLQNIKEIIQLISPTKSVYIAFDGVAPMSKMKQQKMRRLRAAMEQQSNANLIHPDTSIKFKTFMITPGTRFMKYLSQRIFEIIPQIHSRYADAKPPAELVIEGLCTSDQITQIKENIQIVISTSDEAGEGEHKMMQYIREHPHSQDTAAIYGLDSDLIMLALYHQRCFSNLFVFREAPEFFKARIPIQFQHPKEPYFIDIGAFTHSIDQEITHPSKEISITSKYTSYVFLCFLLGNDFLPHFPALNLRTNGIQILMNIYHNLPVKYTQLIVWDHITSTGKIQWNSFSYFLQQLAKIEHEILLQEYEIRNKQHKRYFSETTAEEKNNSLQNVPIQLRGEESYISPSEVGWQTRYYKTLFGWKKPLREDIDRVCYNYLQGIEWVFLYYMSGCPDWKWKYEYDYPPLFVDLYAYLHSNFDSNLSIGLPCTVDEQMNYVLPLSSKLEEGCISLEKYNEELHKQNQQPILYQWAFCKYLWEAHI